MSQNNKTFSHLRFSERIVPLGLALMLMANSCTGDGGTLTVTPVPTNTLASPTPTPIPAEIATLPPSTQGPTPSPELPISGSTAILFLLDNSKSVAQTCKEQQQELRRRLPLFFLTLLGEQTGRNVEEQPSENQSLKLGVARFTPERELIPLQEASELDSSGKWYSDLKEADLDRGNDDYAGALRWARDQLNSQMHGRKIIVLLTDGTFPPDAKEDIEDALDELLYEVELHVVLLCPSRTGGSNNYWKNNKKINHFYDVDSPSERWMSELTLQIADGFLPHDEQSGWFTNMSPPITIPGSAWSAGLTVVSLFDTEDERPSFSKDAPDTPTEEFSQSAVLRNLWVWSEERVSPNVSCGGHIWTIQKKAGNPAFYFLEFDPPVLQYKIEPRRASNGGKSRTEPIVVRGDSDLNFVIQAAITGTNLPLAVLSLLEECYQPRVRVKINGAWQKLSGLPIGKVQREMSWQVLLPLTSSQEISIELSLVPVDGQEAIDVGSENVSVEYQPEFIEASLTWNCNGANCQGANNLSTDNAVFTFKFTFRGKLPEPDYYYIPHNNAATPCEDNKFNLKDRPDLLKITPLGVPGPKEENAFWFSYKLERQAGTPPTLYSSILKCGDFDVQWNNQPGWPAYTCSWPQSLESGKETIVDCKPN